MTTGLMRRLTLSSLPRHYLQTAKAGTTSECLTAFGRPLHTTEKRDLAKVRDHHDRDTTELWFTGSCPRPSLSEGPGSGLDHKPVDERTLKLGKTIRILHERLPTLLASPLPQELLSPQITLRLFPSTHQHLPTVTGKIGYTAALWTSPVAWGRFPVLGNVKLIILSERMIKSTLHSSSPNQEKLLVRWKTCGKTKNKGTGALYRGLSASDVAVDKITQWIGGGPSKTDDSKEFCGLFIFEFDGEGRIVQHIIEHAEESGSEEKTAKVVSVTDWLLGMAKGRANEGVPELSLGYAIDDMEQRKGLGKR